MILTDFPYMLSLANVINTKLMNRPKLSAFVKFYRNHGPNSQTFVKFS